VSLNQDFINVSLKKLWPPMSAAAGNGIIEAASRIRIHRYLTCSDQVHMRLPASKRIIHHFTTISAAAIIGPLMAATVADGGHGR
jgi:hypothetical protein